MIDWLVILTGVELAIGYILIVTEDKISALQRRVARLEQAEGKGILWRTESADGREE